MVHRMTKWQLDKIVAREDFFHFPAHGFIKSVIIINIKESACFKIFS